MYKNHLSGVGLEDLLSDRIMDRLDSNRENRMDFALSGVVPQPFDVKFHQTSRAQVNEYTINDLENNPSEYSMYHSSMIKYEPEEYHDAMREAFSLSGAYGNTRLPLTISIVHMIDGIIFENSYYIRVMKYYHELHSAITGVKGDQMMEGRGMQMEKVIQGNKIKYTGDILYAKRMLFCMNMYLWERFDIMTHDVRVELFNYAFNDIQHNLFAIKKLTYHIMQCAGSKFNNGIGYIWMTGRPVENVLVTDDRVVAKYFEDALRKDVADLAEKGVPNFAGYSSWLCSEHDFAIPGLQERVGVGISEISAMLGLVGFTRGNPEVAIKEESKPLEIHSDGEAWATLIESKVTGYMSYNEEYLEKLSTDQFGHRIYNAMTSNSSGMPAVTVNTDETYMRNRTTMIRSKIFDFLVRGDTYLNTLPSPEYWATQGINTAFRSQPGRRLRRIAIVPNPIIALEMRFFGNVYRYMKSGPDKDKFFMSSAEGGFVDHIEEMTNTGRSMFYTVSGDFDNLDATLKSDNFRSKIIGAITKYLSKKSVDVSMFNATDLEAWMIYSKITKKWFLRVGDDIIPYDGVASGEYGTSFYDSIATASFFDLMVYNIKTTVNVSAKGLRIQGDDFTAMMEGMTDSYYEVLIDAILKTAKQVGLSINRSKLIIRKTYSEVLKVATYVGMLLHRFATIQIFEKEKSSEIISYSERMLGVKSIIQIAVSRGMDPEWGYRYILGVWSSTRKIKVSKLVPISKEDRLKNDNKLVKKKLEYIDGKFPWWLLFAPTSAGGVGMYPFSIIGANMTAVFALVFRTEQWFKDNGYDMEDERVKIRARVRRLVGRAAYISNKSKFDSSRDAARKIERLNEKEFASTSKYRRLEELLASSKIAANKLRADGARLPNAAYEFADREAVRTAVKGSNLILKYRRRDNMKYSQNLIKNKGLDGDYFSEKLSWVDDIIYEESTKEFMDHIQPITNMKGHLNYMLHSIGVGWKKSTSLTTIESVFAPLIGHPDFRKDLTAEGIFNEVIGYSSSDQVRNALIYIGSPEQVAAQIADRVFSMTQGNAITINSVLVSFGDPISQYFCRDSTCISEWVTVSMSKEVTSIKTLLTVIGFGAVLGTSMQEGLNAVKITVKPSARMDRMIMKAFDMHTVPLLWAGQ